MNDFPIYNRQYRVTMPDGTVWDVPIWVIANHRAAYFIGEFKTFAESLNADTLPLFEADEFEIIDWAQNNMTWHKVQPYAIFVSGPTPVDYEKGWESGKKEIV